MAVRMQQQGRDSEISELNYKISVRLNSDSKSEVEGLRWVLTRRAAMGIATMALLILGTLRYSSYKVHERQIEARKKGVSGSTSSSSGSGAVLRCRVGRCQRKPGMRERMLVRGLIRRRMWGMFLWARAGGGEEVLRWKGV